MVEGIVMSSGNEMLGALMANKDPRDREDLRELRLKSHNLGEGIAFTRMA